MPTPVDEALRTATVLDAEGHRSALGDRWASGPCLVVFLRHFGCTACSEHVTELAPRLGELARLGLRTVFVGNGAPSFLAGFVERHGLDRLPVEVVTDPSLEAFRAAGLVRSAWSIVSPRAIANKLRGFGHGHAQPGLEGDLTQQGGVLLVDRAGDVAYGWRDRALGDHAPTGDVIDAAMQVAMSNAKLALRTGDRMQTLIHVANLMFLASYLVKDILWLRMLTVFGGGCLMAFQLLSPSPLWASVGWNVVFSAINVVQIQRLLAERRPVPLAEDELRLYQLAFRSLSPREMVRLLKLARWESVASGHRLVTHDQQLDRMMIVFSGKLRVSSGDKVLCELGDGQFVGEMSFLTGEPPRADVDAVVETRVVSWPKEELRSFLGHNPELRAAWQTLLGADLVGKLRTA